MKTIKLTTEVSRLVNSPGHFSCPQVLTVVRKGGTWARFGLGGWSKDGEGRLVFEGPMVKGPHVYAFRLAGVIDNEGGTAAERERNLKHGMEFDVEEGDLVEIKSVGTFKVHVQSCGYLKLELI